VAGVFIAEGKGGHQRLVPVSQAFFATVACYLNNERPADASTQRAFVALKGPTRGGALSSEGLGEMLTNVTRAGLLTRPRVLARGNSGAPAAGPAVGWPSSATSPAHRRVPSVPGG
jgi:hypothetical protein